MSKEMKIKVLSGYLTQTNKKHIKVMVERGLMSSKINKIEYHFKAIPKGYTVIIFKNEYSESSNALTQRMYKANIQTIFWDEEEND